MPATTYDLVTNDWTSCGAADDALLQNSGSAYEVIFTVDTAKPNANSLAGTRLSGLPGYQRQATIQKVGKTIYARALGAAGSVVVER